MLKRLGSSYVPCIYPFRKYLAADFTKISKVDHHGLLDVSGNMLVLAELCSRFCWTELTTSLCIEHVSSLFEEILNFDMPKCKFYRCDNGGAFVSKQMNAICDKSGVKMIKGRAYTHKSNGAVEPLNQSLKSIIGDLILSTYRETKCKLCFNQLAEVVKTASHIYNGR